MKTPDDIKKAHECCIDMMCHMGECAYESERNNWEKGGCFNERGRDALAYIKQLENHIGELTEKVAQLDHVTRERDALLEIVKELGECNYCKHNSYCPHTIPDCMNCKDGNCKCYSCGHQSKWQWSGV